MRFPKRRLPVKHRKLLSLLLALLLLAGCGEPAPAPSAPAAKPDLPASEESLQETAETLAAESGLTLIGEALDLTEAQLDTVVMTDVQFYEDEAVVRYTQTYEGVEIYGSSMIAVAGEEPYCAGTYFDFSEVFDETFSELAAEAAAVPDWMVSSDFFTFHTDTLRPVIYTTEENEACLARCFEATVTAEGTALSFELIMSLDGSILFEAILQDEMQGFTEAEVVSGISNAAAVSVQDGKYYAYNEEFNVFVADKIYRASDKSDDFLTEYTETVSDWHRVGREDTDLIYSVSSNDWSSGTSADVLQILTTYCNVAEWYRDCYSYDSLDGNGGRAVLALKEGGSSLAIVSNAAIIIVKPEVTDVPEIIAHEFGHAMFSHITGSPMPRNETAALTEALADTFAAVYLADHGDSSWCLAIDTEYAKDIPGNAPTMKDYAKDRYSYVEKKGAAAADPIYLIDLFLQIVGTDLEIKAPGNQSTSKAHDNAFIISHTLYNIWNNVFEKDNDTFGNVLFRSLRYMPAQPNFAQFRDAFIHSIKKEYPEEYAAAAAGCFANAEIYTEGGANFRRMTNLDQDGYYALYEPRVIPFLEMTSREFYILEEQIQWDNCYITDGNMEGTAWNLTGEWEESSYSFNFENENGRVDGTKPGLCFLTDFCEGDLHLCITDEVTTGMTYEEVLAYLPLTPMEVTQTDLAAMYSPEEGVDVILFFLERGTEQILYRAEVYRTP